jgi:hypothetical protein
LPHLYLYTNQIGDAGTERFAGVLSQCPVLARFDLGSNNMGDAGAQRLTESWSWPEGGRFRIL